MAPISPQEAAESRALTEDVNNSLVDLMKRIDSELELNYVNTSNIFLFDLSEDDCYILEQGKAMLKLKESYQKAGWARVIYRKEAEIPSYLKFIPKSEE